MRYKKEDVIFSSYFKSPAFFEKATLHMKTFEEVG